MGLSYRSLYQSFRILLFFFFGGFPVFGFAISDSLTFSRILKQTQIEISITNKKYAQKINQLQQNLTTAKYQLNQINKNKRKKYLRKLHQRFSLEDSIRNIHSEHEIDLLKIRYRKGIELIKIVYEKTLSLDHHFTSMQTFSNIMMLSNPHSYPEFQKTKALLEKSTQKKFSAGMPLLFESNPYLSATSMLVTTLLSNNKKEDKEEGLEKISCILDFTVRMNSDLNIIRHETQSLKDANRELLLHCESLFSDYTQVIGYHDQLKDCRKNDDWEKLFEHLDSYIEELKQDQKQIETIDKFSKKQINLEFATQRVSVFLNQYADFIILGKQHYQKFDNIVSSYENEDLCQEKLPRQFTELKFDIKSTLEKFSNTYDLPELQGSKLKSLLFGVIE